VLPHRKLDFVDDRLPSSLNSQNCLNFDNVVGGGMFTNDALGGHDLLETISFDEKLLVAFLSSRIIFIFDINDGAMKCWNTLNKT